MGDLLHVHEGSGDYPLTDDEISQANRMVTRVLQERFLTAPPTWTYSLSERKGESITIYPLPHYAHLCFFVSSKIKLF